MFKSVDPQEDFVARENELLEKWYKDGIVEKYLHRNDNSSEKFSFLDGPITANNPMGVHHAWGRTYKDFWQRFWNMRGRRERFQNGFDEQGLWVEVEVEKELGLKNKKDIENLVPGDKFASLEKFINLCKERVRKFSGVQTEQSKRLGYFTDWDNSYHTSSDQNNYAIWNFLKVVNEKGWLYKGHDSVPWCPRCGTAISQMEILTEEYKEIYHETVYFKLPIKSGSNEYLFVWTTTPWTIPSNVAVAVNKKETYVQYEINGELLWFMKKRVDSLRKEGIIPEDKRQVKEEILGSFMIGWEYDAPFDDIPLVKKTLEGYTHRVIDGGEVVTETEGTGLLHVAPGAGGEDFKLGKENKLPVISSIEEDASYVEGMGEFSGKNAKKHPELIIDYLKAKEGGRFLLATQNYKHRYPTCWRCKSELVWRVVDEWYIAMDKADDSGKTYREQMIDVAKEITWMPVWGLDRELDWLKNMQDWLISKKRYWGLALPIYECKKCRHFDVIGGKDELAKRVIEGWDEFEGNSPHRPWIDQVKIKCSNCGETVERIPDVGNPWLDAGIVPYSTMPDDWRPADFITESFPGQFKNWFYSLVAMSTALDGKMAFKRVLGFASVRDEKGEEMHKSKGNAIEFNEAANKEGVDTMRWLYLRTNPEHNVNFGYSTLEEIRRLFILKIWNVYSFFITYVNLYDWTPKKSAFSPTNTMDQWILSRMTGNIENIAKEIERYQPHLATGHLEIFVNDLSNWYVRRIRSRVNRGVLDDDSSDALQTLWTVLSEYSKAMAPFIPFLSEEIFTNITNSESVHLEDWPVLNKQWNKGELEREMQEGIEVVSVIQMRRKINNLPVAVPLLNISYSGPGKLTDEVEKIVCDEANIESLKYLGKADDYFSFGKSEELSKEYTDPSNQNQAAGEARKIVRKIQAERKKLGTALDEKVNVALPDWPKAFESEIKRKTLINNLSKGDFKVKKI